MAMLLMVGFLFQTANAAPTVYGEHLVPVLDAADDTELLEVVILMNPRPDVQEMTQYLEGVRSMEQRRSLLYAELSQRAADSQNALLDELYADEQLGHAERIRSIVLTNAISAKLTPAVIQRIADRPEIHVIEYSPDVPCLEPVESSGTPGGNQTDEIEWHVLQVNAPDVWDMGYTGEGVIVAVMDTGVNYNHVDLADHLWDGGPDFPNHGYDVYYDDLDPMDVRGHGTHVAGIVASDGTAGTQAGVAPDATIMCVKVLNDDGAADLSDLWAGIDWSVAHGAHHTTISAGWYNVSATLHQGNRDTYEMAHLAGVTNTKAAGNSGGSSFNVPPEQISAPGWVPSPWRHPDQIEDGGTGGLTVVGSTNSSDNISAFSSHGPVTWESIDPWYDYIYNGGANQGLLKPDVTAPGENVNSCSLSNTGYTVKSGTSMATPCAGGTVALIRSINPNLTPEEVDVILQTTAVDLGATGKDNVYGAGRVDAYQAALIAESMLSDVLVLLDPLYEPFVVLQNGGTLIFDAEIRNTYTASTPGQIWTEAILPNGNTYPLDVYNVTFQPGVDIVVTGVHQNVPPFAPEGEYLYIAKAGQYPNNIIDQDSFVFLKFSLGADAEGDWSSTGWNLTQSAEIATVDSTIPGEFALGSAYPNPFNPTTTLNVTLPDAGDLRMRVYNTLGQEVATLANGRFAGGRHSLTFDASNLTSCVYLVRAQFNGGHPLVQKVILMK